MEEMYNVVCDIITRIASYTDLKLPDREEIESSLVHNMFYIEIPVDTVLHGCNCVGECKHVRLKNELKMIQTDYPTYLTCIHSGWKVLSITKFTCSDHHTSMENLAYSKDLLTVCSGKPTLARKVQGENLKLVCLRCNREFEYCKKCVVYEEVFYYTLVDMCSC